MSTKEQNKNKNKNLVLIQSLIEANLKAYPNRGEFEFKLNKFTAKSLGCLEVSSKTEDVSFYMGLFSAIVTVVPFMHFVPHVDSCTHRLYVSFF